MQPRSTRPAVVVAAFLVLLVSTGVLAIATDFIYTMFVVGAWTSDYWLDRAHIPRRTSAPDAELGFVRKPNLSWKGEMNGKKIVYRSDENGFRNATGVTRADIAFIGDSFTEAAHMPEELTFVQRVAAGAGMRAVNLGRGAYGPQQELIVMKRYALRYHPKVIVWQFFTGNDVNDATEYAHWMRLGRKSEVPLMTRYLNNSVLRRTLKDVFSIPTRGTAAATLRYTDGSSERLRVLYEREPPLLPAAAHDIGQALAEGARLCNERGIKLVVFTVPTMLHILQPYITFDQAQANREFVRGRDADRRSEFTQWLDNTCHSTPGCSFVDVWSALHAQARQNNRGLYIPNDEHLDVRGHQVVGASILEAIRSQNKIAASAIAP